MGGVGLSNWSPFVMTPLSDSEKSACQEPRSFTDCYIGSDVDEPTHQIFDSRYVKRATAISSVANEFGIDFKDARCTVAYYCWLTRQDTWADGGGERWLDDQGHFDNEKGWVHDGPEEIPDEPPEGWQPNPERDGTFQECSRDAPGAVKCWKVATGL